MSSWETRVRKVAPYTPGKQPKTGRIIKLNTNENPYPPSPKVEEVLRSADYSILRRYPDPASGELVSAIAKAYGVGTENVFVGVGSDDVLAMSFQTFFHSDTQILFPDITYSFYDVWAAAFEIPYRIVPLREDFSVAAEDYLVPNGGIVIPNPNAPTGMDAGEGVLQKIIAENRDSVIIIDEAYIDFGGKSVLPLIREYENLLVVRTVSKSRALAGSRIGYALGSQKLISYLNNYRNAFNSYTMDSLTQKIGVAAFSDMSYYETRTEQIIATREQSKKRLAELGFSFMDSKANFIFATHKDVPAIEIFDALEKEGIFVRHFKQPRIENFLRISIGTEEEMDALFTFLKRYLSDSKK